MSVIHDTAVVSEGAYIGDHVSIGPYTVIGPDVSIGDRSCIGPHCLIDGLTTIGVDNVIYGFASIGGPPQDRKYKGEKTRLNIGDRNMIREFVTFNTGTVQDKGLTTLGNDNWIMAYVHVAHDCVIGHHNVLANNATLAGHVTIKDHVVLGGFSAMHQHTAVGEYAIIGGMSKVVMDVPPFMMASGNPAAIHGLNLVGLKRADFTHAEIQALKQAYKLLYRVNLPLMEAQKAIELLLTDTGVSRLQLLLSFLAGSTRGITR